jgi:hypothetical protein
LIEFGLFLVKVIEGKMPQLLNKSEKLLSLAKASLERGDEGLAKEITVLALRSEDAMDALDKLLPHVPEPELPEEELGLSDNQVATIRALASELLSRKKQKLAHSILARLDRIDAAKKRRRAQNKT